MSLIFPNLMLYPNIGSYSCLRPRPISLLTRDRDMFIRAHQSEYAHDPPPSQYTFFFFFFAPFLKYFQSLKFLHLLPFLPLGLFKT